MALSSVIYLWQELHMVYKLEAVIKRQLIERAISPYWVFGFPLYLCIERISLPFALNSSK